MLIYQLRYKAVICAPNYGKLYIYFINKTVQS